VILYLGAHTLEGYVISPLIQARTVHLAPGWLILSQLLGGLAAGLFGILVAAPMMVTLTVIVQMLYVEGVLGDSPHILGD
jgi:predicted PurR-regulated permease PerM